ncbi:hypothetical protein ACQP2P_23135 [Dactylosporangium sp. CA-139114]|uniref:hypothetical protein n=1 Tax=Dactylosporangium sp. CA-139114 TaxID=3239931 RepID=UPI003D9758C2
MTIAFPAGPPDPARAHSLDDLVGCLRGLKLWAGDPSFETITRRINTRWRAAGRPADELARRGTVVDCFKVGRRRVNAELMVAVVQALHDYPDYLTRWRQALRDGRVGAGAAARVRVLDRLPDDLAGFAGRRDELDRLAEPRAVVTVITGMPGVGKTALAVRAGHRLAADGRFDVTLFADLRGFHPTLPPVEPVQLHGELRRRLADRRALLVLDDAASLRQVHPLLPTAPGSLTLVTSRRRLDAPVVELEPLPAEEAQRLLARAVPGVPVGADPAAHRRIARCCGHLPLALALAAGQIAGRAGWTVTDHADRLEEGEARLALDEGIETALHPSYRTLPPQSQALLRRLALHPGPEFGPDAAAALLGTDPGSAARHLRRLAAEHLVQRRPHDRFALHVLVRAYAARRGHDEDRPADRALARQRLYELTGPGPRECG